LNIASWNNDHNEDELWPITPQVYERLKARHDTWLSVCRRSQLASELIRDWTASLTDAELRHELESLAEKSVSLADLRYVRREDLEREVSHLIFAKLRSEAERKEPQHAATSE